MSCLRQANLSFDEAYTSTFAVDGIYLPVQDGEFVKYDPADLYNIKNPSSVEALRNFASVDIINGFNSHEGFIMFKRSLGAPTYSDVPNLTSGLTLSDFNTYVDNYDAYAGNLLNNDVRTSVIHKYTDCDNPGDAIARRTNLLDLISDTSIHVPAIQACTAHALRSKDRHTYMYRFEYRPVSYSKEPEWELPEWVTGAIHGDEKRFMLGFPLFAMQGTDPAFVVPNSEIELSKLMMKFWTQFAKLGNPNGDDTSNAWPEYEPGNGEYIILKTDSVPFSVGDHFRDEYVYYWSTVYPRLVADMKGADRQTNCTYVTGRATSNVSHHSYIILYYFVVMALKLKA